MSRLTPKDWKDQSNEIWLKLGNIHMGDESFRSFLSQSLQKLAHYEDLEEAGRLIELPCKVGTEVFFLTSNEKIYSTTLGTIESVLRHGYAIGDGLYLTKAEAEEELKRLQENEEKL